MNDKPTCYQMSDIETLSYLCYILLLERLHVNFKVTFPQTYLWVI